VLDHPGLDHKTAIVDEAYPVLSRTPIPSTEHPLTSRRDIAAGAGPTVGSSLFGPRWGCSLVPITLPGNDEGDQLKQAIMWQDIEAVPRRSRRTGQHDLQVQYSSNEALGGQTAVDQILLDRQCGRPTDPREAFRTLESHRHLVRLHADQSGHRLDIAPDVPEQFHDQGIEPAF